MKNSMQDLNNHLFTQLERLNDEEIDPEAMKLEIEKSKAIANIAKVVTENAKLELKAQQLLDEGLINKKPPTLLAKQNQILKALP